MVQSSSVPATSCGRSTPAVLLARPARQPTSGPGPSRLRSPTRSGSTSLRPRSPTRRRTPRGRSTCSSASGSGAGTSRSLLLGLTPSQGIRGAVDELVGRRATRCRSPPRWVPGVDQICPVSANLIWRLAADQGRQMSAAARRLTEVWPAVAVLSAVSHSSWPAMAILSGRVSFNLAPASSFREWQTRGEAPRPRWPSRPRCGGSVPGRIVEGRGGLDTGCYAPECLCRSCWLGR
jgi:hypothetical protein